MTGWWSKDTVVVVTGSNKGIGLEIVKGLAKNGVITVLTARNTERGQEAVASLKKLGLDSVVFHQLDVTNADSIDEFAVWLKETYGKIDILINNAGIYSGAVLSYEGAEATLATNYYGVKTVTSKLLPLIRPGGRILTVSSSLGQLSFYGDSKLAKTLGDEANLSEELVDSLAAKYLEDVKAGRWKEEGWSSTYPAYQDSKLLLNGYLRSLAKILSKKPEGKMVYVNALCPGYIATDLNNHAGVGTTEQGADTPVWLALLPEEGYPHGGFWKARKPLEF